MDGEHDSGPDAPISRMCYGRIGPLIRFAVSDVLLMSAVMRTRYIGSFWGEVSGHFGSGIRGGERASTKVIRIFRPASPPLTALPSNRRKSMDKRKGGEYHG